MRINDELFKHFTQTIPPRDSYAPTGATVPSDVTFPAKVPRAIGLPSELPSLFSGEYVPPASNLPMTVSAAQIAAENVERWGNVGPADSTASAPSLAGTQVVENDDEL